MKEKEGYVKDSKTALLGAVNGVFGSVIYQPVLDFILSFIVIIAVTLANPGVEGEQLNNLINQTAVNIGYGVLLACLVSIATLIVFVVIIKWHTFKELCKKAINLKTIKYGLVSAFVIMIVTILYNFAIINLLDLNSSGNANQNGVESLIVISPVFGFLLVVLLAPATEELAYRYCMFGGLLKRKGKWLAYVVSGVIFMIMHSIASFNSVDGFGVELLKELAFLPPYLFSGLVLCYVYDKTNNIGSSFIAHLINNLVSFISIVAFL